MQQPGYVPPAMDITDDDKLWSLLSWIFAPLVPIIVLLLEDKKGRPFIKYNAFNALIFSVIAYVLGSVLSFIIVGCFIAVAGLGYQIYAGIQAYNGKTVVVPVITDFLKKQGWI